MGKLKSKEEQVLVKEEIKQIEYISLDTALSRYRKKQPERARVMHDIEAVKSFVKKQLPSSEASQEEFNKIFDKF